MVIATDWKTLNIWDFRKELAIGKRTDFPANLCLVRKVYSENIYASYLPDLEEDTRIRKKDKSGKKKKRRSIIKSTGETNPKFAAQYAINWVKEKQIELAQNVLTVEDNISYSLAHYWEIYFPKFQEEKKNRISADQLIRDERNKWFSEKIGINKEEFAHKNLKLITKLDLHNYFQTLKVGTQKDIKTLINKLWNEAQLQNSELYVGHNFPSFPKIKSNNGKQVIHFRSNDWELLVNCINQLSGGVARQNLSIEEYENLEFKTCTRDNQRNWVDLFDALWVNYSFFLRSQDLHRLKIEWFRKDLKHREFVLMHPTPKSDRKIKETRNIRDDAFDFMLRLMNRRSDNGWLLFPSYKRQCEGGAENKVMRNMNFLLQIAVEKCLPEFSLKDANVKAIRHTSFRHHFEDDPILGDPDKIRMFAENALTTPEMLQSTYLDYINREETLRGSKKKMRKSNYSLTNRVSDFL